MSRDAQKTATPAAAGRPAEPSAAPGTGRSGVATRLGLAGPSGARRQGALLRRLLASADWAAMVATLCIVTVATRQTDVSTLFWAILFSPAWLVVLKMHGLYDNDHRRIRHSTLDELSALVSAAALGTLALDGLLALSPAGPLAATSAIAVGAPPAPRRVSRSARARAPAAPPPPPPPPGHGPRCWARTSRARAARGS